MGLKQSKEELLYEQASYGNTEGIRSLHQAGVGLEWIDKQGRTPLILACTKPDGLPVATTLVELGADVNAYRPGCHAGTPLHHAAKKGLEPIVRLLLSCDVNVLRLNDDCQTPLDLARAKGHFNVVRAMEGHICLFSGWLRELSGPRLLEAFAPQWVSRKVWAVVLPRNHRNPKNFSKLEFVAYPDLLDAKPRTVIPLWKSKIEEINIHNPDPVVVIFNTSTKARYKFLAANEGDKQQIFCFYNACRGITQQSTHPSCPPSAPPTAGQDPELAMAINSSIQSAAAEAAHHLPNTPPALQDTGGWGDTQSSSCGGWGPPKGRPVSAQGTSGWADEPAGTSYDGWASLEPAVPGTSSDDQKNRRTPSPTSSSAQMFPASVSTPTAPPATEEIFADGQAHYPPVDSSPVDAGDSLGNTTELPANEMGKGSRISRTCAICLDAEVEGACIPCGHMAGCMPCLNDIKAKGWGCPVCRAKIDQVVKLYAV